jgi:hypothetical protein
MAAAASVSVVAADLSPSDSTGSSLVAVLVQVPVPAGLDRASLVSAMAKTVPLYKSVPGLLRKYFIISDDGKFGGVYLWESRAKAEAWYDDSSAWKAGVSRRSGERAQIEYFTVQFMAAGQGQCSGSEADRVVTVVKIAASPGTDCSQIMAELAAASAPQDVPGLVQRYFTCSDKGEFGGIYLWDCRKSAEAYHSGDWSDRMVRIYGSPAEVAYFCAPIVLNNRP